MIRVPPFLVFLLLLPLPFIAQASLHATQEPMDFASQALRLLAAEVPDASGPGIGVLVARGDEVLFRGARGMANVELAVPLRPEHGMRIASLSKQFTAAGLLRLVDEGRVALDDPLSKYLPDYPGAEGITLLQLLNHTSGVRSYTRMPSHMEHALHRPIDTAGLISVFSGEAPDFAPGARYDYNDSGYVLAGAVIEKVTGMAWDAWLDQAFFEPLGLARTRGGDTMTTVPGLANGYRVDADGVVHPAGFLHMSQPHAAGALLSNVDDLLRWNLALHGGKVLSADSYVRMTTPEGPAASAGAPYGLGLEVHGAGRKLRMEHTGGIVGFESVLLYVPADRISVVLVRNATGPGEFRLQALARQLAALARAPDVASPMKPEGSPAEVMAQLDQAFFAAFNACDVVGHMGFLDPALEFYHDKGGRTVGAHRMEVMMRERCGSKETSLRRELVPGSLTVDPVPGYGAIQTGEHRFFLTVGDAPEQWVESARFVHVWREDASGWRVVRALSFDHKAP
ncbi:hypothetical protein GCM10011521_19050 [Arenimonas soli]|uniref:Beta-lactamase-related domain-containing protein n=1 Tax=Arenimonas soli TaxID=2269504 RepID=A0ABQ1HJV1_9GAMM|nr:serine hydrolase [Arenimonas soli]GGA80913.1 hypothetical protein GCM10011521_19050 [Arenimonas soli]